MSDFSKSPSRWPEARSTHLGPGSYSTPSGFSTQGTTIYDGERFGGDRQEMPGRGHYHTERTPTKGSIAFPTKSPLKPAENVAMVEKLKEFLEKREKQIEELECRIREQNERAEEHEKQMNECIEEHEKHIEEFERNARVLNECIEDHKTQIKELESNFRERETNLIKLLEGALTALARQQKEQQQEQQQELLKWAERAVATDGCAEGSTSADAADAYQRLRALIPTLQQRPCGVGATPATHSLFALPTPSRRR